MIATSNDLGVERGAHFRTVARQRELVPGMVEHVAEQRAHRIVVLDDENVADAGPSIFGPARYPGLWSGCLSRAAGNGPRTAAVEKFRESDRRSGNGQFAASAASRGPAASCCRAHIVA